MIDIEDKQIFLSGPVTSIGSDEAAIRFLDARKWLRSHGATDCFVPTQVVRREATHEEAMAVCLQYLTYCPRIGNRPTPYYDMLVSLPGWTQSRGAKFERLVAVECGIPTYDLADVMKEVSHEHI